MTVWEMAAAQANSAEALRVFRIKLSGRQMKSRTSFTQPALLSGLWVFLSMQEVLDYYFSDQLAELRETAKDFF
ncbi:MAG: hypothetical protein IBX55_07955 [Methyloprofundus sp.]|nr:hypothetical protein [Methyloprofundus sp.]